MLLSSTHNRGYIEIAQFLTRMNFINIGFASVEAAARLAWLASRKPTNSTSGNFRHDLIIGMTVHPSLIIFCLFNGFNKPQILECVVQPDYSYDRQLQAFPKCPDR